MYKRTAVDAISTIIDALNISMRNKSNPALDEIIKNVNFSGKSVRVLNYCDFLVPIIVIT